MRSEIHELLCAYVLGEASPEESARVEAELAKSEELRAERARLEATIGLVRSTREGDEHDSMSDAARTDLVRRAELRRPTPLWRRPALRAAAAAVVLIGGGLWASRQVWVGESVDSTPFRYDTGGDRVAGVTPEAQRQRSFSERVDPSSVTLEGMGYGDTEQGRRSRELKGELEALGYLGEESPGVSPSREQPGAATRQLLDAIGHAEGPKSDSSGGATSAPLPAEVVEELSALGYVVQGSQSPPPADALPPGGGGATNTFAASPGSSAGPAGPAGPVAPGGPVTGANGRWNLVAERGPIAFSAGKDGDATSSADDDSARLAELRQALDSKDRDAVPLQDGALQTGSADWFLGAGELDEHNIDLGRSPEELRRLADELVLSCRPRPRETPGAMFFRFWGDNPFELTLFDSLSTFAADVDTASYAIARNYLQRGNVPPKEAIRTEEFVNYFDADVDPPLESDFAIHTDLAPSRFGASPEHWMLRVVVRGREVAKDERTPLALTFVVDTSGSMRQENRMELVKHALRLLVGELDAHDSIALVAFNNQATQILPMTSAANRATIEVAINGLQPGGGTNAEGGLRLGYATASDALSPSVTNRVVFLSDGVANIGQTDQTRIGQDVAGFRDRGIYLNTIGVGMGNHNDVFLEQLADEGDGLCNYVDSPREARRALVENFTGAMETIARDVKIQVELDPEQVESYRLLGYENRAVADADFRNDAVDAGEIGSGHQVTALYELVRVPGGPDPEAALATVRLRWKRPHNAVMPNAERIEHDPEVADEISHVVRARSASGSYAATPAGYRRAVLVAQFAEFLRRSVHTRGDSLDALIADARTLEQELDDPDFTELVLLMVQSRELILRGLARGDELTRAVDALREQAILLQRYRQLLENEAEAQEEADRRLLQEMQQENARLEARIRELVQRKLDKR